MTPEERKQKKARAEKKKKDAAKKAANKKAREAKLEVMECLMKHFNSEGSEFKLKTVEDYDSDEGSDEGSGDDEDDGHVDKWCCKDLMYDGDEFMPHHKAIGKCWRTWTAVDGESEGDEDGILWMCDPKRLGDFCYQKLCYQYKIIPKKDMPLFASIVGRILKAHYSYWQLIRANTDSNASRGVYNFLSKLIVLALHAYLRGYDNTTTPVVPYFGWPNCMKKPKSGKKNNKTPDDEKKIPATIEELLEGIGKTEGFLNQGLNKNQIKERAAPMVVVLVRLLAAMSVKMGLEPDEGLGWGQKPNGVVAPIYILDKWMQSNIWDIFDPIISSAVVTQDNCALKEGNEHKGVVAGADVSKGKKKPNPEICVIAEFVPIHNQKTLKHDANDDKHGWQHYLDDIKNASSEKEEDKCYKNLLHSLQTPLFHPTQFNALTGKDGREPRYVAFNSKPLSLMKHGNGNREWFIPDCNLYPPRIQEVARGPLFFLSDSGYSGEQDAESRTPKLRIVQTESG